MCIQLDELLASLAARGRACLLSSLYCILFFLHGD